MFGSQTGRMGFFVPFSIVDNNCNIGTLMIFVLSLGRLLNYEAKLNFFSLAIIF